MAPPEHDQPPQDGPDQSGDGGDRYLLAEACRSAGLDDAALSRLTEWLAKQLERESYARLEQAGHSVEERIPLAKVFVDLEVAAVPLSETEVSRAPTRLLLQHLCASRPDKDALSPGLQSSSVLNDYDRSLRSEIGRDTRDQVLGVLLIGGPGQGKSTLGQLLCQLHRAWVLRPRTHGLIRPSTREAVAEFTSIDAQADLGRPETLRFPIRIPLADAAAWLASNHSSLGDDDTPALLRWLAWRAEHDKISLNPADLLHALRHVDWLLVLDGLDEVPASSNRDEILEAARALLRALDAERGLLLATTRPQGYAGELNTLGALVRTYHLAPLSTERAMGYARRLVAARFTPDRRETVLARLKQAATAESTSRLMRTPLQVTILATLVDRIGRAPSARWTLYHEYYRVIYEREMERHLPCAQLLREYRAHIDRIHARVGLLLQVEAERSSGTGAALSLERFAEVVDAVLAEDEIDATRRARLITELGQAARERLVLIVEPIPGKLGFEVRSLQEFMAALALSQKKEAVVEKRIQQILKAGSFRGVLLFLASKAFTELSDLRDELVEACRWLNGDAEDSLAQAVKAGSVLALEILEEGSALKQDKYVRKLVEIAAELMELPPSPIHGRLARVCVADAEGRLVALPILQRMIDEQVRNTVPARRLGAWITLVALTNESAPDMHEIAERIWREADPALRVEMLKAFIGSDVRVPTWLGDDVLRSPTDYTPEALEIFLYYPGIKRGKQIWPALQRLAHLYFSFDKFNVRVIHQGQRSPLSLYMVGFSPSNAEWWEPLAELSNPPPTWRPWVAAARFLRDPSGTSLAAAIRIIAEAYSDPTNRHTYHWMPWPITACINSPVHSEERRSVEELYRLSLKASAGAMGARSDWETAEKRWRDSKTVEFSELMWCEDPDAPPYEASVGRHGLPVAACSTWSWRSSANDVRKWLSSILSSATADPLFAAGADRAMQFWKLDTAIEAELSPPFVPASAGEEALEEKLLALSQGTLPDDWTRAGFFIKYMADVFAYRQTGLADPATWDRLELPLPYPEQRTPSVRPPPSAQRPVVISSLRLENLRIFDDLSLTPAPPDNGDGQWIVLIGENGAGKSTLLRALALALVDLQSQPNRLPASTFAAPWRHRGVAPTARSLASATVRGRSYQASFHVDPDRSPDNERFQQAQPPSPGSSDDEPSFSFPVFAYGCRRGSALGGASRQVNDAPGAEIYTLFDEGADLIHAETWFLLRENEAQKDKEGPAGQVFRAIQQALCAVLRVDAVWGQHQEVWVRGAEVGEMPLAALSDGYLTTMGWIVDLIARWIRRAELRKEPIHAGFTQTMTGLVLIDEIDLYLHPAWQRHVITDIRKVFPRLSFVVTTHNPLTLLGAKAREIWRLRRGEDGRVIAEQGQETPALLTGSDIYDAYFGISKLFPDELGEMLDRYSFLARNTARTDEEQAEMQDLRRKLQEREVEPGWEPVPREPLPPYTGDPQA